MVHYTRSVLRPRSTGEMVSISRVARKVGRAAPRACLESPPIHATVPPCERGENIQMYAWFERGPALRPFDDERVPLVQGRYCRRSARTSRTGVRSSASGHADDRRAQMQPSSSSSSASASAARRGRARGPRARMAVARHRSVCDCVVHI